MPVKEIGCGCRDIDPGGLAKVLKEKAFFNVAKTNGPRYRSTHVCDLAGEWEGTSIGRASSKSMPRRNRATSSLFARRSGLPLDVALRLPRFVPERAGPRCPLPELLYVAFGVNVHLLVLRLSLSELPIGKCLKFGCRMFARSTSIKHQLGHVISIAYSATEMIMCVYHNDYEYD